jgi:hypothetical protein
VQTDVDFVRQVQGFDARGPCGLRAG